MKSLEDIKADAQAKWIGFQYRVETKVRAAAQWAADNKEVALGVLAVAGVAIRETAKVVRGINNSQNLKKEQELQDLYVYDHSLGMYHKLRRPLKPSEKIEIDRRRANGETKIQILASMGLLD